jgi:hypothetical protein
VRTRAAAVGSQRLIAWAMARPNVLLSTIQKFDATKHELMTASLDKQQVNEHHHHKH